MGQWHGTNYAMDNKNLCRSLNRTRVHFIRPHDGCTCAMYEQVHDHELDEWPELEALYIRAWYRSHVPLASSRAMHIPRVKYYTLKGKFVRRERWTTINSCIRKIYSRKILHINSPCFSLVKYLYCHVCILIINHTDIASSLWINYIIILFCE